MTQPTRAELISRVRADYRDELGVDPIEPSWETAAAFAQAILAKGLYGRIDWALRQLSPDTADDAYFWRHALILGVEPKAAAPWRGTVTAAGTPGTVIPALSELSRTDGQTYRVDAVSAVGSTILVTALTPGATGNNTNGQRLGFSPPIIGVGAATVTSTSQTGSEAETREEAQPRVLARLSDPPRGGSLADYRQWALEVEGVTRAGAQPLGVNSIVVWALRDNDGTGTAILPDLAEAAQIQAHIDTRRPAQVRVTVIPLMPLVVNITIADLQPNNPAVKAAITASLTDFFSREAAPASTLHLSRIDAAISEAEGETSHSLTSPSTSIVSSFAQVPVLGSVTFP